MSVSEGYLVQGERVTMPVRIRDASAFVAMYSVPAGAAQELIDYSGLRVLRPLPGKALCGLLFVNYVDGDLGLYHEFGVSFLVRRPGSTSGARGGAAGVFIHRLPVDQPFTLEAGRTIWGFPKAMAEIDLEADGRGQRSTLRLDGQTVADLRVKSGLPAPGGAISLDAYTHLDGATRRVPWQMKASGTRWRPGGAELDLGDHPWAAELAGLGLPKRALMSSSIPRLRMVFGEAETVFRR